MDIIVTEIGYPGVNENVTTLENIVGGTNDAWRQKFWEEHLTNLTAAVEEDKAPVKAFLAWALMDNFEWYVSFFAVGAIPGVTSGGFLHNPSLLPGSRTGTVSDVSLLTSTTGLWLARSRDLLSGCQTTSTLIMIILMEGRRRMAASLVRILGLRRVSLAGRAVGLGALLLVWGWGWLGLLLLWLCRVGVYVGRVVGTFLV